MAQCKVTSYYSTRKRVHESKIAKQSTKAEGIVISDKLKFLEDQGDCIKPEIQAEKIAAEKKSKAVPPESLPDSQASRRKNAAKKAEAKTRNAKPKGTKSRTGKGVRKGTATVDDGNADIRKVFETQKEKSVVIGEEGEKCVLSKEEIGEASEVITKAVSAGRSEDPSPNIGTIPTTPKRHASRTEESLVVSPKKKCVAYQHLEDLNLAASSSPDKEVRVVSGASCKKLDLTAKLDVQINSPKKQSLEVTVTNAERSKLLNSGRLHILKERHAKFCKSLSIQKESQNNKFKSISVIPPSSKVSPEAAPKPKETHGSTPAAYEKFHSLAVPGDSSLTLPYKYKLLSEAFRCSDTVVSILHNRKETCSFQKLKKAVQDMMKRDFSKNHLGQIRTVFPLAYYYSQEKNCSSRINPQPGVSQYQLVITPNLKTYRQQSDEKSIGDIVPEVQSSEVHKNQSTNEVNNKTSGQAQVSSTSSFMQMNPSSLIERKNIFNSNLLKIVKKHHQDFLARLNPPITVPLETALTRWHPKFPLDRVPDVQTSPLPEPLDVAKLLTASDVFDKIKGTVSDKIEKALLCVADKNLSSNTANKPNKLDSKESIKTGILKGISCSLLEKIRAREASKIVLEMTRPPEEKKRMEMMQRIPEMVRILRNLFITARKAAVSIEEATQKIMDSCHSAISSEDVKAHLQLIAEVYPKWLNLITIRKGVFLKIDKNTDINLMLDNIATN